MKLLRSQSAILLFVSFFLILSVSVSVARAARSAGGESWGYVQVRPKAHMFWWLYRSPYRQQLAASSKPWPTVLWLQGGPVIELTTPLVVLAFWSPTRLDSLHSC
uniref:Uncharacterized protein n=1 Tax=Kalanchoe fedtschenkoi TaxID=63787 RepID=A0A7N0VBW6_KALFE